MDKEIVEGNRLIAEFMGKESILYKCEYCDKDVRESPICDGDEEGFERSHALGGVLVDLKYHSSWEWLMPVVEKIKDLYMGEDLHEKDCEMYSPIESALKEVDRFTLFKVTVRYIQWYNTQTKNS